MMLRISCWLTVLLCFGSGALHAAPRNNARVALVVGNSRYEEAMGPLKNPANDAKAMAKALRGLGFSVTEERDVDRDELWEAIGNFRDRIKAAEVALFYYAGHGVAVGGSNYLIPVKSGYQVTSDDPTAVRMMAETRLFNADQVLAEMNAAGSSCNLVILDACRSSPMLRDPGQRSTVGAGLVEMRPPAGSLVAFATDAGRVASDGDAANGLYTGALLKHLQTPGLTIEQVFKRTRAQVMEQSKGMQIPVEYSRLIGQDIYLAGQPVVPPAPAPVQEEPPKALKVSVPSIEEINRLASEGRVDECLAALYLMVEAQGRQSKAEAPLDALLELAKEELKRPTAASGRTRDIMMICEKVSVAIVRCLPADHPRRPALVAKAQNRRGDCLLLEQRAEEAIACYNAAIELAPEDPYPLFNRGRAQRMLGRQEEAKADFTAVCSPKYKQPLAKRLAQEEMKKDQRDAIAK